MKLAKHDANRFFERPNTEFAGILIYGQDAMRVALKRQALVAALVGPKGEEEMRFTRLAPADLRSDPTALTDALAARSFFPGQQAVLLEDATDGLAKPIAAALENWRAGDAFLVVTAGALTPRSPVRKLFETSRIAAAAAIYTDPPDRDEVEAILRKAGISQLERAAEGDLMALAQQVDPGDFAQIVEKLALYTRGQTAPVSQADVEAVAPRSVEADADEVVAAVADHRVQDLPPLLARVAAQGVAPTTLCIQATRHFRQLHAASCAGGSPDDALGRLRPPVMGPRRRVMAGQLRRWSPAMLEAALKELMDTDLALRSSRPLPQTAMLERALVRIAMMRPRTGPR